MKFPRLRKNEAIDWVLTLLFVGFLAYLLFNDFRGSRLIFGG